MNASLCCSVYAVSMLFTVAAFFSHLSNNTEETDSKLTDVSRSSHSVYLAVNCFTLNYYCSVKSYPNLVVENGHFIMCMDSVA